MVIMKHLRFELPKRESVIQLAAILSITLIQGCGGGGGDSPSASPAATNITVDNTSVAGLETAADSAPVVSDAASIEDSFTTIDLPEISSSTELISSVAAISSDPTTVSSGGSSIAAAAAVTTSTGSTLAWARPAGTKIATFNSAPDQVAAWNYLNGVEYPGASGSLASVISDRDGLPAARLHYDLGCNANYIGLKTSASCGRYVAINYKLPQPISLGASEVPVLAFDMRNPQSVVNPIIRVTDSTGQVLQFTTPGRNLEVSSGDFWRRVYLPISRSTSHYGGANDGVLHPPVQNVQLGAGGFAQQQPPGWIDFDNVELVRSPVYSFELKPAATLVTGTYYPTYVNRLAVATYTSNEPAHDKAKAVGINIVRRDLSWSKIEKNGAFNFADFNVVLEKLRLKGMSVLWILDYGHPDHGGKTPASDADKTAFANFARAAALNFKGKNVVGFEIWNEPNGSHFWPNQDPLDYLKLYTKAALAIREVDPAIKIITGGTAGVDINYSMQFAANVNPSLVDAVAIHPYTRPGPESFSNGYQPLRKTMASRGLNKPIWVTEWGYSSYGDFDASVYGNGFAAPARNRQGMLVLRKVLSQMAMNMPFMTIYALTDYGVDPVNREANFGIMAQDASDKPAIVGLRSLYAAQNGRTFKGYLTDVPPGLHTVRWDGASDKVFAIWTDQDAQASMEVRIPLNATAIKRWNGTTFATTVVGSYRVLTLREEDGPVMVTLPS